MSIQFIHMGLGNSFGFKNEEGSFRVFLFYLSSELFFKFHDVAHSMVRQMAVPVQIRGWHIMTWRNKNFIRWPKTCKTSDHFLFKFSYLNIRIPLWVNCLSSLYSWGRGRIWEGNSIPLLGGDTPTSSYIHWSLGPVAEYWGTKLKV